MNGGLALADPDPYEALGTVESGAPATSAASHAATPADPPLPPGFTLDHPAQDDPYAALGTVEQPQLHTYATRSPSGQEVRFQLPSTATDDEVRQAAARAVGSNAYLRSQVMRDGSPVESAAHQRAAMLDRTEGQAGVQDLAMQGMTFGMSDEINGAINQVLHPFTPGEYQVARDATRIRLDEARSRLGWGATAAELLGGLVGGGGFNIGGGKALATLGQAAKQGAIGGAIGGGVAGYGYGNGTSGSLVGAGAGALLGGTVGGTLPVGVGVASQALRGLNRLVGSDRGELARQIVGQAIEADGATPATVGQRLVSATTNNVPLGVADTGENTRALLASVARPPGPARTLTRGMLTQRQAEQGDRVVGAVGRDLGPVVNVRQQSDDLLRQAQAAASPLYDQAYAISVPSTPELDAVLNTPFGRQAIARAHTIIANERGSPTALGYALGPDGAPVLNPQPNAALAAHGAARGELDAAQDAYRAATQTPGSDMAAARSRVEQARGGLRDAEQRLAAAPDPGTVAQVPTYSMQALDYAKRGMDDVLEQYRNPITGKLQLDEAGRAQNQARSQMLAELDRLNPAYAQARRAYAGPASAEEAMQSGRQALNSSAEDIEATTGRMTPEQRAHYALGLRAAMADNLGRAVDGADKVSRLLGTPRKRAALAAVFGGEDNFNRFLQTMADERATTETYRSAMTGSPTADRLASDAQTGDTGLLETAVGAAIRGAAHPVSFFGNALQALRDVGRFGVGDAGNQTREGVASLLTETDPQVLGELARSIEQSRVRQQLGTQHISSITGLAGSNLGKVTGAGAGKILGSLPSSR